MSKHHHDHDHDTDRRSSIEVRVRDNSGAQRPITQAQVGLFDAAGLASGTPPEHGKLLLLKRSDGDGHVRFDGVAPGTYVLGFLHHPPTYSASFTVGACDACSHCLEPSFGAQLETRWLSRDCADLDCRSPQAGDHLKATVCHHENDQLRIVPPPGSAELSRQATFTEFSTAVPRAGRVEFAYELRSPAMGSAVGQPPAVLMLGHIGHVAPIPAQPVTGQLGIALSRTETEPTEDVALWLAIRNGTDALGFNHYLRFMDVLFGGHRHGARFGGGAVNSNGHGNGHGGRGFEAEEEAFRKLQLKRFLPFNDSDSYRVLKAATEAFVMVNCGVLQGGEHDKAFRLRHDNAYLDRRDLPAFDDPRGSLDDYLEQPGGLLPYLALVARKLPDIPIIEGNADGANLAVGFVHEKLSNPCLVELIWSYWHEEAMLVQTMNAVTRRFQNRGALTTPDPLANLEIDPLRPLNSLLWGYTQDEQHRLTVNRRNAEYAHQYGLTLRGKAVKDYRIADSRSQFLEGFHHLLRLLTAFYKQDDDTTVKADAFPVLNALKEVHLVMSQGAHNNFGELATTARIEMLMQQWLLGRPEFREFLPSRIMVAYPEPWMDRVDAMKKLQGWTDTSVVHFRNLAIFGEQVMLAIRVGNWSEVFEPTPAFNFARYWRPQIQGYIHAYRAATGIDLSSETADPSVDAMLPSLLMQRRLAQQQRNA
jgi:hypothetical protein